jgi:hypothetical protein
MAAGPWIPTSTFVALMAGAGITGAESWKIALFLSTSNLGSGSTSYSGVSNQHPAQNGYATGGVAVTLAVTGDAIRLSTVPEFVATSGEFVARGQISARYAALYIASGNVAAYCLLDDTPADVTAYAGQTLRISNHDVFGIV